MPLSRLLDVGIFKSHIQNLAKNPNGKVIPFVRMFELKMCDQQPSDYQIPVSQYSPKRGLHLVAWGGYTMQVQFNKRTILPTVYRTDKTVKKTV